MLCIGYKSFLALGPPSLKAGDKVDLHTNLIRKVHQTLSWFSSPEVSRGDGTGQVGSISVSSIPGAYVAAVSEHVLT